ncbi:hypothetical protein GOBAR_AA12440 [Gossypium barbadense]|uniref:Uncharacterized protein n=1 Tax=Gossypium barbadense TaxID=3634 RepID=A0A2P5XXZ3_GOSBA|nr:hypothetical protein GOBAR_AA12440 [Gossypium barbadense]
MLGKVLNRFDGARIWVNWLEDNFEELPEDPTDEIIEQYARAFIMSTEHDADQWLLAPIAVMGLVVTIVSTSQNGRPMRVPIGDKNLHKLDMRRKNDKNYTKKQTEYIQAWDCRIESLPVCEPFFSVDTTIDTDYMTQFRAVEKSYLLSSKVRSRQIQSNRQRHLPQKHRKRGCSRMMG